MTLDLRPAFFVGVLLGGSAAWTIAAGDEPAPTREFKSATTGRSWAVRRSTLWGLRCGNALHSEAITERHIRNLDNMTAHGINLIGVYIQGSNAGWPDADAALNGFTRDGQLKPPVARRLETLIREADRRGMVVMVGLFTHRKDQALNQTNLDYIFADCRRYRAAERGDAVSNPPSSRGSPTTAAAHRTPRWAATAPVRTTAACGSTMNGSAITWAAGSTPGTSPCKPAGGASR